MMQYLANFIECHSYYNGSSTIDLAISCTILSFCVKYVQTVVWKQYSQWYVSKTMKIPLVLLQEKHRIKDLYVYKIIISKLFLYHNTCIYCIHNFNEIFYSCSFIIFRLCNPISDECNGLVLHTLAFYIVKIDFMYWTD